jgi:hypothetical protein
MAGRGKARQGLIFPIMRSGMSPWTPALVLAVTLAACVAGAFYFVEYVR